VTKRELEYYETRRVREKVTTVWRWLLGVSLVGVLIAHALMPP